jgi:ATP-binding cassette subfamily C protein CydD
MISPAPSGFAPRVAKAWLNGLLRLGGVAAVLPIALPLLSGALLFAQAATLAHLLQRAIVSGDGVAALLPHLSILGGLLGARMLLGLVAEICAVHASETIKKKVRAALAAALLDHQPVWSAARSSGALSSTLIEQVDALDGYLVRYLPAMVQATILPLAFAALLFPIDWVVGLLLVITIPLIPVFMALVGWGAEAASAQQAEALGRLSGRFADRLRGLTTLKLFGREAAETAAVASASEQLRVRTMQVMRVAFLSSAVLEFFAALGVAGVALYIGLTFLGLVSLRGGAQLSLEAGLFCLLMAPELYAPLRLLAAHYHDRAAAKAAVEEIGRQFEALPAINATTRLTLPARPATGPADLRLSNVSISAPQGETVISGVSLDLVQRQTVAILGPSGIGKSTLLEAIARLRDFTGAITLDGRDITELAESELRARIAMLGQRPRIFAGSIADNIRLGRRDACDTAVRLAARRAVVTDFADTLPEGLATRLGEDGLGLSGGEIQRVALARLYLRDAGLLLLDEPTAHLDAATEARVLDGLLDFARSRTLLVATHSPEVAARMQRVYRIAGGGLLPAIRPAYGTTKHHGAAA